MGWWGWKKNTIANNKKRVINKSLHKEAMSTKLKVAAKMPAGPMATCGCPQCAYLFSPRGLVAEKALKDVEHSAGRSGGRARGHQGEHSGQ